MARHCSVLLCTHLLYNLGLRSEIFYKLILADVELALMEAEEEDPAVSKCEGSKNGNTIYVVIGAELKKYFLFYIRIRPVTISVLYNTTLFVGRSCTLTT